VPVSPRTARATFGISLILLLANCGEDPTGPGEPGVRAVAGAGITDTVDAELSQALVVEVRDQNGALASGVEVRFEPKASPYYYETVVLCPLSAVHCGAYLGHDAFGRIVTETTDARGRAKVLVGLGHVAGPGVVRLVVPELGFADSVTFTITPGAAAGVRAVGADPGLDIGGTATLSGLAVDRYDNARTEKATLSAGPGSAITLNAATGVVTARDMGTQWVFMRYNVFVDSARVRVLPAGRLLVWAYGERAVRLVNLNGSEERTIVSNVSSAYGALPQFDQTRQRITLYAGTDFYGDGAPNTLIVIDTTGTSRRDIGPDIGFIVIMATRYLADGTVLVVGISNVANPQPGYSLWRVSADNTITFVVALPGLGTPYQADISHDGKRVAYVSGFSYPYVLRLLDVVSGSNTVLDTNVSSPRWSAQDDRLVYLGATSVYEPNVGLATVINANGSGRRVLGTGHFYPGISWSPDGTYVIGHNGEDFALRVVRVSDGAAVSLRFPTATGCCHDYGQPDWR
jgi:hypothetical protein